MKDDGDGYFKQTETTHIHFSIEHRANGQIGLTLLMGGWSYPYIIHNILSRKY